MDSAIRSSVSTNDILQKILKSRKNSNLILELEERLLSEDDDVVLSSSEAALELFLHFIENKEICFDEVTEDSGVEEKYKIWLKERFEDFRFHMLSLMHHQNQEIQETAVDALMKLLKAEGEHLKSKSDLPRFPKKSIAAIVCALVKSNIDMLQVIKHFHQYLEYEDVKLHVLKSVLNILDNNAIEETPLFFQNIFALLSNADVPKGFRSKGESDACVFIQNLNAEQFVLKQKVFSKVFSQVWFQFLKHKLPSTVYKKVLVFLPKKVLPHLNEPLILTDFFTDSYNVGGIISLLALNGVFYLMQNFNLEYPEFYNKLYAMFTHEILISKFRARFFFLSDLFLSSTHLPSYLVAAFIKRLSRLALCTPVNVVLIILPFIKNLLIRHPSLKCLIHSPGKEAMSDPYNFDESDPTKCCALESSLWEVKSLQSHWNPEVSKKARFVNSELPPVECDFSDQLEISVMDMAEKELSSNSKEIPTFYDKPGGFFKRKEDTMSSLWTL